ncbi:ubiquinone biosynthesis regulatory protein kinase UbiB [Legionella spiritensis]|uniref:Probable protein kinase UbiB n=1 Tax=Legionella spiritensis TaxID=452 RepID=A0A0W0YWH8_LEGSP|nr:ubiquinone biosynthesis regulatory protein kinase UbiB [Legionella spiritensis]KTD61233.1 ubiquinone biosynthesis AarF [Legionella spiritensis]SNV23711.1 ubiquinone biosynthesis protein [Legionella spiritensis]VEG91632.1 ubiquinone biosynthesis protein [Legionella spiritensis]
MKSIRQLIRLLYINTVLARNGLDQLIVSIHLFSPFRFIVYLNPWNWWRKEQLTRGQAIRKTLEELGPIFIKFGQALSTRPDILPPDIARELCKLQDKVPPFPSDKALAIIEEAFGQSAFDIFAEFDTRPLASASMAQVHAATLQTGEKVVVKILRPNMLKIIKQDLSIMHTIAYLADRYWSESKRLKPKEIVAEFEQNLLDELDLQREAANAGQLRRNFNNSHLLYVPEIYWDYTRENVMVMERVYGVPVADIETLRDYGVDIKKLAERGVEIFFTQVFRDCFFHADMHPGNIFVSTKHPDNPQYICIDFGIIGTLSDKDKRYLAENLYAFFNRDYRRVAQLHVESGWVARTTRVTEFESAIRTVCEPIFEKPLKDISFGQVVMRLFQVARRFHMEVQPQLVLLQKTLLAIEGLGRQLYPELDLWTTAKPFLEKWIKEQIGPRAFVKQLHDNLPFFTEQLPHMPRLLNDILILSKEQKMRDLSHTEQDDGNQNNRNYWIRGLGVGVFTAMMALGVFNYLELIKPDRLTPLAIGVALIGGLITFINKTKRS